KRRPPADLQIVGPRRARYLRAGDIDKHLSCLQNGFDLRRLTRKAVKLAEWHLPTSSRAFQMDDGVKRQQSDSEVGRVSCDAMLTAAQNRVESIGAFASSAATTRPAFVARKPGFAEVRAAGALQQVSTDCRHIAELGRGAELKGLAHDWKSLLDAPMGSHVTHASQGAHR